MRNQCDDTFLKSAFNYNTGKRKKFLYIHIKNTPEINIAWLTGSINIQHDRGSKVRISKSGGKKIKKTKVNLEKQLNKHMSMASAMAEMCKMPFFLEWGINVLVPFLKFASNYDTGKKKFNPVQTILRDTAE